MLKNEHIHLFIIDDISYLIYFHLLQIIQIQIFKRHSAIVYNTFLTQIEYSQIQNVTPPQGICLLHVYTFWIYFGGDRVVYWCKRRFLSGYKKRLKQYRNNILIILYLFEIEFM